MKNKPETLKAYYESHKEKIRNDTRAYRETEKLELIKAYGGKCECCGETAPEFLAIDHVNGGGGKARRNGEGGGWHLARKIRKLGYPKEYRVLCHNCNSAIGVYGYCPHKQKSKFAIL